ncbi:19586_t:CDS:2, partial [Gigaspora rosea]
MGVIMWQLVTRKTPFESIGQSESISAAEIIIIGGHRPPELKGIPSSYSDIMKRCWDTNPEQRPDAEELFNHFDKMLEQIGTDKFKNSYEIDDDSEILQHLNIEVDNKKLEKSENLFALKLSQHISSDISNKNFKNIEEAFDNLLILELSQDMSINISRKNSESIGESDE